MNTTTKTLARRPFNKSLWILKSNYNNITSGYNYNSFDTFGCGHSYNRQYYAFVKAFDTILNNTAFERIRKYDLEVLKILN